MTKPTALFTSCSSLEPSHIIKECSMFWLLTALLFMFWDVWYYLQILVITATSLILPKLYKYNLMDEVTYQGICLTTDLDAMLHMNNARYLRECDFGRIQLWLMNGVWREATKFKASMTLGGSTIRFRKSLQLFDRYKIKTRVVCWDSRAFYVEQRFVRDEDGFVAAIALLKQTTLKTTPSDLVRAVTGRDLSSPPIPDYVQAWIRYSDLSSEALKKEA